MNATCLHVDAPSSTVLSYDMPVNEKPSLGSWFHSLHATSHALHPMHSVVSVKNPLCAIALTTSRFDVTRKCFRFLNRNIWIGDKRDQFIGAVSFHQSLGSP